MPTTPDTSAAVSRSEARLDAHERDIERLETSVTRHREIIVEVQQYLSEIRGPITWGIRFAGIAAIGILGTFGIEVWQLILKAHR